MARIGYSRVSTKDQEAGLANQVRLLTEAGCEKVYQEHVSAVNQQRPELAAMLSYLREGDSLVITSIDRLARDIIELMTMVTGLQKRGVYVQILNIGLDTGTISGRLVLTILGAVAEAERMTLLERQRVGIAAAKALGHYKGHTPTARVKTPEVLALLGTLPVPEIARQLKMSRASAYRIAGTAGAELRARAGLPPVRRPPYPRQPPYAE